MLAVVRQAPIWAELRQRLLSCREGGAIRKRLLDSARDELGGSLMECATGGSHTPESVQHFMSFMLEEKCARMVKDAYGATEFPGISANGIIAANVELRLDPVRRDDQLLYSPDDRPHPRGEVMVRLLGETPPAKVFYWNRPEKTAAAWDSDGWYRTGDVGELDYQGKVIPNEYQRLDSEEQQVTGHTWTRRPLLRIIDRVSALEEVYIGGDSVWIATSDLEANLYVLLLLLLLLLLLGCAHMLATIPRPPPHIICTRLSFVLHGSADGTAG